MAVLLPALAWSAGSAVAAPTFTGAPEDVAIARAAWAAAVACTGREGRAAPIVEIVRKTVPLEYLGVARTDPSGALWRIDLGAAPGRHREVLVHEVTHGWISDGPVALVEGTAELLADCIVARSPGLAPLQFDDGRALDGLPDLRTWRKPDEDTPAELHSVRTDAYLGAARLVRTAALVVGPDALWADHHLDWAEFEATLSAAGPAGRTVLDALAGGAGAQRAALADADRDGLTALAERIAGTDDGRFDSDGDGWWDGAPPRGADAVVVPLDATPVCAGRVDPRAIVAGGNLRGANLPPLQVRTSPGGPVLVRLASLPPAESSGALLANGAGGADTACRSTPTVTVWAEDPAFTALVAPVADAVERGLALAASRYGPGPQRVALALGGARSTVEDEIVWLSSADVRAAVAEGNLDGLALLAVSLRRAWVAGACDWSAAEAVARSLDR